MPVQAMQAQRQPGVPVGTTSQPPIAAAKPAHAAAHGFFHITLSELNPLQYLPVIGTLYRAITGDTVPETARTVGTLVVSGLTSGPIGVAINLATLAAEKVTGIDPETIAQHVLADIGTGAPRPQPKVTVTTVAAAPHQPPPPATAWSPAQLAAYGVTIRRDGNLQHGALTGSDVLNDLELARTGVPTHL